MGSCCEGACVRCKQRRCIISHSVYTVRKLTWVSLLGRRGQELGRVSSRSVGDLPFNMAGFPWNLSSSQLLPGQLGQLGSLSQTSSGVLSRSHEDVVAGMQRELSAERGRMGRISLSQSIEPLQQ